MAEINLDWKADDSELNRTLDDIITRLEAIEKLEESTKEGFQETFNEAAKAAKESEKASKEAAAGLVDQKKKTDEANESAKAFTKSILDKAKSISIFGVNVGDVISKLQGMKAGLTAASAGTGGLSKAMKLLRVALISTGIGAIVVALGSLVAFLTQTASGSEKVRVAMKQLGQVFNVLLERVTILGEGIFKLFSGDFQGAAKAAQAAISGIGDEIAREVALIGELERRLINIEKSRALFSVQEAKTRKGIRELRLKADDEENFSLQQRLQFLREAGELEKNLVKTNINLQKEQIANTLAINANSKQFADLIALAGQNLIDLETDAARADAIIAQIGLDPSKLEDLQALAPEIAKLYELEERSLSTQNRILNEQNTLRDEARAGYAAFQKQIADFDKQVKDLLDSISSQRGSPLEILNFQKAKADEQLEQLREFARQLKIEANLENAFKVIGENNARAYQEGLNQIFSDERVAAHKEQLRKLKIKAEDIYLSDAEKQQIANEIGDFERVINGELALLPSKTQNVAARTGKLFGVQIAEGIGSESTRLSLGEAFDKIKDQFFGALGLDSPEQQEAFASQISGIYNNFAAAAQANAQAQIDANQRIIDSIRNRISETENALEEEKQLQEDGYANNVAAKERELEELRKREAAAQAEQLKLRKEQLRAQQIADGISQASSLISAAANITKGFSSFGPYSLILIPLALAALFSFFAKAKADAKALQSQPQTFRKGGKIKGRSHEAGGVGLFDQYGKFRGEAEDREWIINQRASDEHDKFLNNLNEGKYKGLDLVALANKAKYKPRMPNMELIAGRHQASYDFSKDTDRIVGAIKGQKRVVPYGDYIEMSENESGTVKERKIVRIEQS